LFLFILIEVFYIVARDEYEYDFQNDDGNDEDEEKKEKAFKDILVVLR
jgi:hypothetical protein